MDTIQLFKCLSDETRLTSTLLIQLEGELCVCELIVALELSQPKISRHLAQLRNCGLLTDQRRGQWVYYSLHPDLPNWAVSLVRDTADSDHQRLKLPLQRLQSMKDRPNFCSSANCN
ncbi:metalloregulator ArsR/SmtB family transcription factor [Teredinibacter waterburyi]|uniref:metalloregulator ArsR/SmtB family transcription factor n=1 Tax=Teredinibacter waterburyi TaxID=1500538 RepID=UPI00165EF7AD|nr:metalloregulator ArsR/SmtB family transcription factor [Teredinibacter waterburyi]